MIFIDPSTQEEIEVGSHSTVYRQGVAVHLDRHRKELVGQAGLPLVPKPKALDYSQDTGSAVFAKFSSRSPAEKKRILKERSHKDFIKNVEPKKRAMNEAIRAQAEGR